MTGSIRLSGGYDAEHFVADGSLRDVCVPDAGLPVWERLVAGLADAPGEYRLSVNDEVCSAEDFSVPDAFVAAEGRLAIDVAGLWFVTFFFDADEIEFSFAPEDVTDSGEFGRLERFMLWLAEVCDRKVILTMEASTGHRDMPALLETLP